MFPEIRTVYLVGPAITLIVIITLVLQQRSKTVKNPMHRALVQLRIGLISSSTFAILLWFLLPITPVLSTFGFPDSVQNLQPPERLLETLQDYNRAIVRTADVVFWFLFVFVWWCLSSIYVFSKAIVEVAGCTPSDTGAADEGEGAGA